MSEPIPVCLKSLGQSTFPKVQGWLKEYMDTQPMCILTPLARGYSAPSVDITGSSAGAAVYTQSR